MSKYGQKKSDIFCQIHPSEKVKYFCRDDKTALCPDCVVHHARHDFIMANEDASREVKDAIKVLHNDIDEKYLRIKDIQDKSRDKHA